MHQSIMLAVPIPSRLLGIILPAFVSPGCGALTNFAWPGGQAFANPGATSTLLTHT